MTEIKNLFLEDPEKTFMEAGLIDQNNEVTAKGNEALLYVLWHEEKDELLKIACKIVENNKNQQKD